MILRDEIVKTIDELKKRRKFKSQKEIAEYLGYNSSYFSRILGANDIPIDFEKKFFDHFPRSVYLDKHIDKEFESNVLKETKSTYIPTPQKFAEKKYKKEVTVIPAKAQLGLKSYLYPDEMINDLETKTIFVDNDYKGKYYEIECVGDSMDSDHRNAIRDGDHVLCREISKMYWRDPFHKNDWEFVFFHNEYGIIIKCIKEQNLENGDLLLSSYNEDKEEYPDFMINIKDCHTICNVVQVIQNRKKYHTL